MPGKLILPLILILGSQALAQDNATPVNVDPKWAVEVELIQPFIPTIGIYQLQLVRTLFSTPAQNGALVIGAYLRPNVKHDVVEEIDEYMFYAGYRHYFWKGLHAEAGMNTGYYWGSQNLVDGRDYKGPGMYYETNIGYRLNIGTSRRIYVVPQFGFIGTTGLADIGPRQGKPDNFLQGNLLAGINF